MKKNLLGLMSVGLVGVLLINNPAAAQSVLSFTYTDPSGSVNASFTLDVNNGQATSASGTITSSVFSGTDTFVLLTPSSSVPLGSISGNGCSVATTSCVTWPGVPGTGGANLTGDTVVNATGSPQYFDGNGILLAIKNSSGAYIGGLNIWATGSAY